MPHPESSATEAPGDTQPTADHPPTDHPTTDPGQAAREQWHAGGGQALSPDELGDGPHADHPAAPVSTEERESDNTPK